jgi:hypothetical protein
MLPKYLLHRALRASYHGFDFGLHSVWRSNLGSLKLMHFLEALFCHVVILGMKS